MNNNEILVTEFKKYRVNYNECVSDIRFVDSCISQHIIELKRKLPNQDYYFDSGFYVHNVGPNADNLLKGFSSEGYTITPDNIQTWQNNLLSNINIIHIVKFYNAIERLIIISIRNIYFPDDKIDSHLQRNIDNNIKKIGYTNTRNNKHLMDFLVNKSKLCSEFLSEKINTDQNISYKDLFTLLSMLRNNIAHNGGYINSDIVNKLKGIDRKIVDQYFNIEADRLLIKDNMQFLNFFDTCDKLAVNLIKFIYDKPNLEFLNMK